MISQNTISLFLFPLSLPQNRPLSLSLWTTEIVSELVSVAPVSFLQRIILIVTHEFCQTCVPLFNFCVLIFLIASHYIQKKDNLQYDFKALYNLNSFPALLLTCLQSLPSIPSLYLSTPMIVSKFRTSQVTTLYVLHKSIMFSPKFFI